MYDILILWAGASGLFCSLFLPPHLRVAILEKTDQPGKKILLSWGERCNVTNIHVAPEAYFGQNTKMLPSIFHQFGYEDMITFLHEHGIQTKIEDNGRVILQSGKSRELLDLLQRLVADRGVELLLGQEVQSVHKESDIFVVTTPTQTYQARKVIVATGGLSYPQIGASGVAYGIAEDFALPLVIPHAGLCGMETKEEMSPLAGNTLPVTLSLFCKDMLVYKDKGSLLFTHRGITGPVVFNASLLVDQDPNHYRLQLDFDIVYASKAVVSHFKLHAKDTIHDLQLKQLRPIAEAKVTAGGVMMASLDAHFQSKEVPGLYFIGEALDITGKT